MIASEGRLVALSLPDEAQLAPQPLSIHRPRVLPHGVGPSRIRLPLAGRTESQPSMFGLFQFSFGADTTMELPGSIPEKDNPSARPTRRPGRGVKGHAFDDRHAMLGLKGRVTMERLEPNRSQTTPQLIPNLIYPGAPIIEVVPHMWVRRRRRDPRAVPVPRGPGGRSWRCGGARRNAGAARRPPSSSWSRRGRPGASPIDVEFDGEQRDRDVGPPQRVRTATRAAGPRPQIATRLWSAGAVFSYLGWCEDPIWGALRPALPGVIRSRQSGREGSAADFRLCQHDVRSRV